jgi:hypothetical protein
LAPAWSRGFAFSVLLRNEGRRRRASQPFAPEGKPGPAAAAPLIAAAGSGVNGRKQG